MLHGILYEYGLDGWSQHLSRGVMHEEPNQTGGSFEPHDLYELAMWDAECGMRGLVGQSVRCVFEKGELSVGLTRAIPLHW